MTHTHTHAYIYIYIYDMNVLKENMCVCANPCVDFKYIHVIFHPRKSAAKRMRQPVLVGGLEH